MGRPKKNSSALLVSIMIEFYEQEANGDTSKVRFTSLSEYAKNKGYDIEEQHFRRDKDVLEKLDDLRSAEEEKTNQTALVAYRNLDVNELLMKSATLEELKRNITGLDAYWRAVYQKSTELEKENKRLKSQPTFEPEVRTLEGKIAAIQNALLGKEKEVRYLSKEVTYLKSYLRKYLYPSVAEALLQDEGRIEVVENDKVDTVKIVEMIEGKFPQAYNGMPHEKPQGQSRIERLLQEMSEEVDDE